MRITSSGRVKIPEQFDPERLVAFAASEAGVVIESRDAGESWESLGLVLDTDAAGHVAVDPTDPATVWIGTFGESLWRTIDGGERWEQLAGEGVPTDS